MFQNGMDRVNIVQIVDKEWELGPIPYLCFVDVATAKGSRRSRKFFICKKEGFCPFLTKKTESRCSHG
ncbi:hypothetical protein D3C78_1143450 [compost metagenome]